MTRVHHPSLPRALRADDQLDGFAEGEVVELLDSSDEERVTKEYIDVEALEHLILGEAPPRVKLKREPSPTETEQGGDDDDEEEDEGESEDDSEDRLFVVEGLIDKRAGPVGLEYRVRWKDYGPLDDTWEPVSNLTSVQTMIEKFEDRLIAYQTHRRSIIAATSFLTGVTSIPTTHRQVTSTRSSSRSTKSNTDS